MAWTQPNPFLTKGSEFLLWGISSLSQKYGKWREVQRFCELVFRSIQEGQKPPLWAYAASLLAQMRLGNWEEVEAEVLSSCYRSRILYFSLQDLPHCGLIYVIPLVRPTLRPVR